MKSLQKIEKLQERALKFLYNDHKNSNSALLLIPGRCTMQVSRQRTLSIEIYKTMNNLNPPFIFYYILLDYIYHLKHMLPNQVTFGSNSLESVGPQYGMVYQTK